MKVKVLVFIFLILPFTMIEAQRIGTLAPEKDPEIFPANSWGADLMFGEGGFGLGTFYRRAITRDITGFVDLSFSESKDDREVEYVDWWGNIYVIGKVNRVFLLPLNFGIQYRLFSESLTENLRPYITAGVGPTFVITTPYELEFFESFGKAKNHYALGGYVGLGANIGSSKSNLIGLNVRYYYIHMFDEGVENLIDRFRKNFGHVYLTLNVGIMY
jgi:hypothetical protein